MQSCPTCGDRLPPVADAFCPSCHQSLEAFPAGPSAVPARPVRSADDLSPRQREYLLYLRAAGPAGPTVRSLYRRAGWVWLRVLLVAGGIAVLAALFGRDYLVYFCLGLVGGYWVRDSGTFRVTVEVWPVVAAVIDWHKVETLLGESDRETIAEPGLTPDPRRRDDVAG